MPTKRYAARGPAVLPFLFVFAFAFILTGCEVSVEEPQPAATDGQRVAMSTSAAPLPLYDVSISAIDFDPPLRRDSLINSQQPEKLVAAVENKGSVLLRNLTVEAHVTNQTGDFSARDQVQVDKLAPGETKVVQFGGVGPVTSFPMSPSYRIKVLVDCPQLDPSLPKPSRDLVVKVSGQ